MTTPSLSHLIHARDADDVRDFHYQPKARSLPAACSLVQYCPPPYTQGQIKSCSAHAISGAIRMLATKNGVAIELPSRLFIYYNSRVLSNDPGADNGSTIRNALKASAKPGVCAETYWPYDETKVFERPAQAAYDNASLRVVEYARIDRSLDALRSCIVDGYPFLFGIQMYQSTIATAQQTGNLLPPQPNDTVLGGHAILAVGYDDAKQSMLALNSCGPNTGDHGYFHVPYSYFESNEQTYDFWSITKIG